MSDRKIARALRFVVAAVPVALAVAAFAPGAQAFTGTTYPETVLTPGSPTNTAAANGTALQTAVNGLTAAGGFNLIQLCACTYLMTSQTVIPANVQVEITGPPLYQENSSGSNPFPTVQGQLQPGQTDLTSNVFAVSAGDNAIFKAFDIEQAPQGFAGLIVNGGNAEVDNMSFYNEAGVGINTVGGTTFINNSTIANNQTVGVTGSGSGVTVDGGTLTMSNSTDDNNQVFGITGNNTGTYNLYNDLLVGNQGGSCDLNDPPTITNAGTLDDDLSCGGNTDSQIKVQNPVQFNGGPNRTDAILSETSTADEITSGCPTLDGRFFTTPSLTTCQPGAWQTGGTISTEAHGSVAPISCTVKSTTEITGGTGSSQQVVSVTDTNPTSAMGPDLIVGGTTNNGTISWPVVTGSLFDETTPGGANWLDGPTDSEFDVTATKTAGDATAHDTTWSFNTMDWLGNTKACS